MKYNEILFDYTYLFEPEDLESVLPTTFDLMMNWKKTTPSCYSVSMAYLSLFGSIARLASLSKMSIVVIIYTFPDNILQNVNGRQLLCEVIYLYGEMLLILEESVPGPARERIMMANYRYYGDSSLANIEEICKLCKSTGYVKGGKDLENTQNLSLRFPVDQEF